ncbi:hypothetical protein [Methyloceanibacter caenitepidi]|uniref:Uncharacterized protein n=1 Tax=Methyloceanibacter caenitepidi TaxID=1384459 RepID=A0A0A8K007_9HYPH|nr:hypothetical protein [Methyloceanibacter caenitepidi]BAQ16071.1 hypothetical protein GL4_0608 [Methyloceanibacter caenitepidi]
MARKKNVNWDLPDKNSWDAANLALLMDIRDELQKLNALLACRNFTDIPTILRGIRTNTAKPRKKTVRKATK